MRNAIAVMNTKGGVGKSTVVLGLAETLSAMHGLNVLIVDSDAQASVSAMVMSTTDLYRSQSSGQTIVELLISLVLNDGPADWRDFVIQNTSDVDEAGSVSVIASDMQLTLLEREISRESRHGALRATISVLLAEMRRHFDVVLIDCPPGLSVLTESWLREADFYISPTKADYVSVCGLEVFRRFKALNPEMGFAENLGVLVNMRDAYSPTETEYVRWLAQKPENRCFSTAIPRMSALQDAARFSGEKRSYVAKYPGDAGLAMRAVVEELLARVNTRDAAAQAAHAAGG